MPDEFDKLPAFEWRDQKYPISARDATFTQDGIEHKIEYRDNEFLEQLGAGSLSFTYTLVMRQGVAKGAYKDLFVKGYPLLFAACRDHEEGVLVDPFLGEFVCAPKLWNDNTDFSKRDGADVRVEFRHSPKIDEAEDLRPITIQGVVDEAGKLDEEIKKVDWEQEPSPEPMSDVIDAITGVGAKLEANAGKVDAGLNDLAFKCEKLDHQIDRLENPNVWPLKRSARRTRAAALSLQKRAKDPSKQVVTVVNNYNRTLLVLAQEVGMTVQELILQNPSFALSPFVLAGTAVNIVKKKRAAA
jgi:hypothetical protein